MANQQTEPSEIAVEHDVVTVDGPGGVVLSLTPEAAEETGRRLTHAAQQARRNQERD